MNPGAAGAAGSRGLAGAGGGVDGDRAAGSTWSGYGVTTYRRATGAASARSSAASGAKINRVASDHYICGVRLADYLCGLCVS